MAIAPKLELRQSQALVMTPQLQQAIKLLQLSNVELVAFVEQELERNPLLEATETEGGDAATAPAAAAAETDLTALAGDPDAAHNVAAEAMDAEYDNTFTNDSAADAPGDAPYGPSNYIAGRGGSAGFDDDERSLEQTLTGEITLREHLQAQFQLEPFAPADRLIGMQLIDLLDEAGYLTEPVDDIAARLGCPPAQVEAVLRRLQQFDPAGVFARSLAECLALQLKERDRLDPAMQTLLDNLDLLARRDMAALMKLCGVDAEDITEMARELRALNPKPGLAFDHEVAQTLVPDVLVRRSSDGGWLVELNSDTLPRVLVNTRYYARVSGGARSKAERSYLSECLNSANWLVKSLDQRANTILKVASEIVRQQDAFLTHGVHRLRPLNLRAIAEAIGMHESTVSRVTTNKYMATPRGIFELKYFFTAAIAAADGGAAHSAEAVRQRIRELIGQEKPDEVLSDDRLVEVLLADGIDIARRTVAKYREALRIPSSVERRRLKRLTA
jgi:RNA polymerase sigma-54 factor